MAFNINLFSGALKLGGARPSLFQVTITNPVNGVADIQVPFMARATRIPAETITPIELRYFGRAIKIAGTKQYEDWTVTVFNDEDFAIRHALEEWSNAINSPVGNLRELGSASPALYRADVQVTQFSKTGAPLRVYNLRNAWPNLISPIELDWDVADQIETYEVTFSYDYHEVTAGITGTTG